MCCLGWLSPLTTKLKLLFQEIWKTNLQWDDPVPENIQEEWFKIQQEISVISEFQIPRWLKTRENDQIELHGFCDASTKAYGCVVYCKVKRDSTVILVAGKTKLVSVSQKCSLPRLELCGAVLLAKLMSKIKKCLANYEITIYCWVDSMVVLGWLNGEVGKWKPFVENRVRQITASIAASSWRYVASKENPADCASRGLTAMQLKEHKLWWEGPTWLPAYEAEKEIENKYVTNQELKNIKKVNVLIASGNEIIKQLLEKCSSLRKNIKILAWVLRIKLSKKNKNQAYLSVQELRKAKMLIIKAIQTEIFSEEINNLQLGKSVSTKSRLYNLNPFLDENGILRVGGRLRHANLDPERKHPVIIPNNTRLADLIIDQAHESSYHGGARLTSAYIRRQYWLLGGNNSTKKRLRFCVKCRRQDPELQQQLMGDLPLARANPSRPYFHCGVDYTGHVNVKANKGRGSKSTKGYVAVFVCMASKAVHLELVSDLTTSAFIAALRRMAARRGVPGHLYSDQGRNFIGADRVLKEELKLIQQTFNDELSAEIASMGVEWHFNCASWPSGGGLWEAAVKSLKHHLKRVIGEQHLTFEEFTTVLTQLEATLNSRPLCPLTEDPDDLDFLTPSHFLSSGPLLTLYDTEKDLRTRWHLTQKIFQDVWRRWRDEYLTQLTARSKWRKSQPNIKIGDVVIIKDDNLPPGKWSLGRVVELHPGKDGHVRVVTLKTKHGFLQRPIVKLSLLPIYHEQQNIGGNKKSEKNQEDIQKNRTFQKPSKTKKSFSLTSAVTLLTFFITLPSAFCTYNIKPLNYNSLYFDRIKDMHVIRDDWTLVVYYDTEPYQVGNEALDKYIQYLDRLCSDIKSQSYCEGVLLQLRHESNELQYYNDLLMNHHNKQLIRKRRGLINGIGNIANTLFGVLDDRFAEKYERDISLIKQNQNHLAALWKNQTSVVEAEFNLLKRTEVIVNKNNKLINRKINALENIANQVNTTLLNISLINDFLATSLITNNLLFSLKNVQQTLLDAITNVYNGKISFHLLTPDQLRHELGIISEQLPKDLSLPVKRSDSLSEIYNLLQVRARVIGNYIIFEIKIPLLDDVMYEISRVIPVPHKKGNDSQISVLPVSEFVAVNLRHDAFINMAEMELRSCLQHANLSLCRVRKPVNSIKDDQSFCETLPKSRKCKTVTGLCKNRWTELHNFNTYFFFACEQYHLKLACEDEISLVTINSSGILRVNQGCSIKSSDSVVYTHRQELSNIMNISSTVISPEISPINHLINISVPSETSENDILNHTFQFHDIEQKLKLLSDSEPLISSVSTHDIHHYVAIYILFSIAIFGAAVWAWRQWRCVPVAGTPAPVAEDTKTAEPSSRVTVPASVSESVSCMEMSE